MKALMRVALGVCLVTPCVPMLAVRAQAIRYKRVVPFDTLKTGTSARSPFFGSDSPRRFTVEMKPLEVPYWNDSLVRRNTCPMPVAHSQIVDPLPVAGFRPPVDSSASRVYVRGSVGQPMRFVSPCYNPLDTRNR